MRDRPTTSHGWWILAAACAWGLLLAGCERRAVDADNATSADAAASPANAPAEAVRLQPADSKDDAAAPRELPQSRELQPWVKTEPVRVAKAANMAGLIGDDAITGVLQAYRTERVARCKYQAHSYAEEHSPAATREAEDSSETGEMHTSTARVLLIEMATAADAFGAFSILNPHAGCSVREDGSMQWSRTVDHGAVLSACQGRVIMIANCSFDDPEVGARDCERLVARTMFSVPAEPTPLLVRAVRELKTQRCGLWMVRSTALLKKLDVPSLSQIAASQMDKRLGLDGHAVLSVVAAAASAGDPPMVIWLAEYEKASEAQATAKRYTQATQPAQNSLDNRTMIGKPRGRFLVGTWTADQKMARNLVALLEGALVEP